MSAATLAEDEVTMFEIEDDFDPLADSGTNFVGDEEPKDDDFSDYVVPIPDAEKSIVPPPEDIEPAERVRKLFERMPGQRFRLLRAVEFCAEPRTLDEVAADLDAAFPDEKSVYTSMQIVRLLARDGALEEIPGEPEGAEDEAAEPEGKAAEGAAAVAQESDALAVDGADVDAAVAATDDATAEGDYLEVEPAAPSHYVATEAGLAALETARSLDPALDKIREDTRYLPIYQRILDMCLLKGGRSAKELDAAVDNDPICQEPRRYCGYFLNRLEITGALVWSAGWKTTELGQRVLASDVFAN